MYRHKLSKITAKTTKGVNFRNDKEKGMTRVSRGNSREILVAGIGFFFGWIFCLSQGPSDLFSSSLSFDGPTVISSRSGGSNERRILNDILAKRPNWRTDYNLDDWIPRLLRWIPKDQLQDWKTLRLDPKHMDSLYSKAGENPANSAGQKEREDAFWKTAAKDFTYGAGNIGLGHRLAQMSYSYVCNVVPNRRQQLVHWDAPGLNGDNRAWHYLFEDSPAIMGVPSHLRQTPWGQDYHQETINFVNERRNATGTMGQLGDSSVHKGVDCTNGDFNVYYRFSCGPKAYCQGFRHPADLWLLRFAKEPSAQELYMMLRAQLKQHVKNKIATFIENYFPKDKLVIGVHIRSGNGKDDNLGHFDRVHRGDWLEDLPAAITMVRKQIRMIAYSILDRMNVGGDFLSRDEFDPMIDDKYHIFVATDSSDVLKEFKRQDPSMLSLPQDRVKDGEGVAIFKTATCTNASDTVECAVRTQEAMLLDMMILSSCDATLAGSFSNFMYTMPATLAMAEGRIFCESGRAALGGQYIFKDKEASSNFLGQARWWVQPPPNTMPVRCHQGAWAARDRSNLNVVKDVAKPLEA